MTSIPVTSPYNSSSPGELHNYVWLKSGPTYSRNGHKQLFANMLSGTLGNVTRSRNGGQTIKIQLARFHLNGNFPVDRLFLLKFSMKLSHIWLGLNTVEMISNDLSQETLALI